jgi:hypothetical protein
MSKRAYLMNYNPLHLRHMALFAVNTGGQNQEICKLRWEWEVRLAETLSVFVVPGKFRMQHCRA